MWSRCSVTCSSKRARFVVTTLSALSLSLVAGTVAADACWLPPVDAPVVDPFRPPPCAWCPGNRGLEYGTPDRVTVVRAVAAGEVTFSGTVAGTRYVVVRHADGRRATYGGLAGSTAARRRRRGSSQRRRARPPAISTSASASGDLYIDPAPLLGRLVGRPRLVPVDGTAPAPARRRACDADDRVRAERHHAGVPGRSNAAGWRYTAAPVRRPAAQSYPRHIHLLVCGRPRRLGQVPQPQRRLPWPSSRMRQMLEAGVHFGHQTRRWNPKMKRFIFGERNGIYIIDLEQTLTPRRGRLQLRPRPRRQAAATCCSSAPRSRPRIRCAATPRSAACRTSTSAGSVACSPTSRRSSKRVGKMLEYERMKASGEFEAMIKKEALMLDRELEKLQRNLGGLRDMKQRPDAVFVLDTKKEHIAVTEANKLGIPVVAVVDTNVDPDVVQFPIPGNDDAIRANALLIRVIAEAVEEGRYIAAKRNPQSRRRRKRSAEEEAAFAAGPGRRPQRRRPGPGRARRAAAGAQARLGRRRQPTTTSTTSAAVAAEPVEAVDDARRGRDASHGRRRSRRRRRTPSRQPTRRSTRRPTSNPRP